MVPALCTSPLRIARTLFGLVALAALTTILPCGPTGVAHAQDAPTQTTAPPEATESATPTPADAPEVLVDPETGERYVEVRPEEGLARGRWPTDRLVVIGVVSVLVLLAAGALARRVSRSRS